MLQVNSIYDPLELPGPFTVRAKIMMRQLWASEAKRDWDYPLPEENKRDWVKFFSDLFGMNTINFKRCVKPPNAVGDPSGYGACAYVRWALDGLMGLMKPVLRKQPAKHHV